MAYAETQKTRATLLEARIPTMTEPKPIHNGDLGVDPFRRDKLFIDMIGSVDRPHDKILNRGVRIQTTDAANHPVKMHCVQISDSGICANWTPEATGKYTVKVEYTFDVVDTKPVEAKMMILDGRFANFPTLIHNPDESWETQKNKFAKLGKPAVRSRSDQPKPIKEEDDEFLRLLRERKVSTPDGKGVSMVPRASLAKQVNQTRILAELVGEKEIMSAAKKFSTLDEVIEIMKRAGLKHSNLLFAIDYTASNKTQGLKSFRGQSLHTIETTQLNPYQKVISVVGRVLQPFTVDQESIPAFGFGDVKTSDTSVFPFLTEHGGFCRNFEEVMHAYNKITPKIILSGPTNFAPIIKEAIKIYKEKPGYYLLVIVADGQVNNEPATLNAIVTACRYPISILLVGVGDGPWSMMDDFDRKIPTRTWDNFDFVDFHKVTEHAKHPEASFAVHALSGLPDQYAAIKRLGILPEERNE